MEVQALNSTNFPDYFSFISRSDSEFRLSDHMAGSSGTAPQFHEMAGNAIEKEFTGNASVRCPSNAAMKVQKCYRSYRTRRMLADSAVVVELWWQALDFAQLNHSTISFFNLLKPETAASRWNRVGLNASKVGKGLSKDAKAQKLAFQHWIEAVDPRHRYGHSLHFYFDEWRKTNSGQPFFYWLDLGDGRDVDLEECPRSKLRQQCITYLGPQERELYEYLVVDGKLLHKLSGKPLDTNEGSPGSKWIFVMSTSKQLYSGVKKKGLFHHSSFLAGGVTLAAGRLMVEDGVLKCISAYSGHYKPTDDNLDMFLSFLKENGVDLGKVEIKKPTEDSESNETEKTAEDESISEIPSTSDSLLASEKDLPSETTETKMEYKRTLSGSLQSPKTDISKTVIERRINTKNAAKSYQLGHQLSFSKWSSGAGPRIGCVADYPVELRLHAMELTRASPRTCSPFGTSALVSPSIRPSDLANDDVVASS